MACEKTGEETDLMSSSKLIFENNPHFKTNFIRKVKNLILFKFWRIRPNRDARQIHKLQANLDLFMSLFVCNPFHAAHEISRPGSSLPSTVFSFISGTYLSCLSVVDSTVFALK
jgi:hypothetical protein